MTSQHVYPQTCQNIPICPTLVRRPEAQCYTQYNVERIDRERKALEINSRDIVLCIALKPSAFSHIIFTSTQIELKWSTTGSTIVTI